MGFEAYYAKKAEKEKEEALAASLASSQQAPPNPGDPSALALSQLTIDPAQSQTSTPEVASTAPSGDAHNGRPAPTYCDPGPTWYSENGRRYPPGNVIGFLDPPDPPKKPNTVYVNLSHKAQSSSSRHDYFLKPICFIQAGTLDECPALYKKEGAKAWTAMSRLENQSNECQRSMYLTEGNAKKDWINKGSNIVKEANSRMTGTDVRLEVMSDENCQRTFCDLSNQMVITSCDKEDRLSNNDPNAKCLAWPGPKWPGWSQR